MKKWKNLFKEGTFKPITHVYLKWKQLKFYLKLYYERIQCWFVAIIMATTTTATANRIKSCVFIQTIFETMGMHSPQANQKISFNKKILMIFLCFALYLIASFAYFLYKTESIGDLAFSYSLSLSIMLCLILMIINTLKIRKYDELIRKS